MNRNFIMRNKGYRPQQSENTVCSFYTVSLSKKCFMYEKILRQWLLIPIYCRWIQEMHHWQIVQSYWVHWRFSLWSFKTGNKGEFLHMTLRTVFQSEKLIFQSLYPSFIFHSLLSLSWWCTWTCSIEIRLDYHVDREGEVHALRTAPSIEAVKKDWDNQLALK